MTRIILELSGYSLFHAATGMDKDSVVFTEVKKLHIDTRVFDEPEGGHFEPGERVIRVTELLLNPLDSLETLVGKYVCLVQQTASIPEFGIEQW